MLPVDRLIKLGIEPLDGISFKAFTNAEITDIESRAGAILPDSYRQLLVSYGAVIFTTSPNCSPDGKELYFQSFYNYNDLVDAIEEYEDTLPESVIPFGHDGLGNQFCISVEGYDIGKVYFYNHSIDWHTDAELYVSRGEHVPDDIRYSVVYKCSDSFDLFILAMK